MADIYRNIILIFYKSISYYYLGKAGEDGLVLSHYCFINYSSLCSFLNQTTSDRSISNLPTIIKHLFAYVNHFIKICVVAH